MMQINDEIKGGSMQQIIQKRHRNLLLAPMAKQLLNIKSIFQSRYSFGMRIIISKEMRGKKSIYIPLVLVEQ
jgi:hypothetical protein